MSVTLLTFYHTLLFLPWSHLTWFQKSWTYPFSPRIPCSTTPLSRACVCVIPFPPLLLETMGESRPLPPFFVFLAPYQRTHWPCLVAAVMDRVSHSSQGEWSSVALGKRPWAEEKGAGRTVRSRLQRVSKEPWSGACRRTLKTEY